jgi:Luciferase-like monooxygenase
VCYNLMFPMRAVKHWNRWRAGAGIGDIARLVEEAGFDAFSMSEHPYPDWEWLARGGHHAFDPFVSLSFAAAATTRIRLMTYLLVSGYCNPYLTAKAAASFDLLARVNQQRAEAGRDAADVAFVPFEADLLASGDCEEFCAAVQPRRDTYAEAGVTWITIEPASRSFSDFPTDIDMLSSQLVDR